MKKLFSLLTKATKIQKILLYVYRVIFTAKSGIVAAIEAYKELKPEAADKFQKLEDILSYVDVAYEGLEKILDWFGVSATEREAARNEAIPVDKAKTELAKTINQ